MRRYYFFPCLLACALSVSPSLYSQTKQIDSLENILKKDPENPVTLGRLVMLYSSVDINASKKYAEKSYKLCKEKNDTINLSRAILNLGNVYWLAGEKEKAKQFLRLSYSDAVTRKDYRTAVSSLSNIGRIYIQQGNPKPCIDTLLQGLVLAKNISTQNISDDMQYKLYCSLGEAYHFLGQNEKGIEALIKAKQISESNSKVQLKGLVYEGLGMIYQSIDDRKLAIQNALLAINCAKAEKNNKDLVKGFYNLSDFYTGFKNYDSAKMYLELARDVQQKNNLPDYPYLTFLRGRISYLHTDYDSALADYKKVLPIYKSGSEIEKLGNLYRTMGEAFQQLKKYDSANIYFNKALPIYRQLNLPRKINDVMLSLSQIKVKTGDYEGAYNTLQAYDVLRDTIINNERPYALADLEVKYKTSLKEATIAKQQSELKVQKQRQNGLITIALIVLAAALGFGWLYGRAKKQKAIISKQNQLLEESNKTITKQKSEILHFQKNANQLLYSMFNRQAENELQKENVKTNKERVFAMSLLHALLYEKQDNILSLKKYLEKLCEAKVAQDEVVINCNVINEIPLKAEQLKDVGIIVNELITNAIKYAFVGNEKKTINVFAEKPNGELHLKVIDTGIGLPESVILKEYKTSFGLDYVNDLVEQYDGELKAYNNNGANFDIILNLS
ncbi:MAG: tetratricopeptide repeat protein [Bacteroidetes bacterium]|nr:tetratricopeptide repeat protein [Bacteroidota bacterium]